jgi:hypothetical protein
MALSDAIKSNKHKPVRRLYVKRRLFPDGEYESEWVRVDKIDGIDRVVSWGSAERAIDYNPGQIGGFSVPDISLTIDNSEGAWNYEKDSRSIFAPYDTYLGRRLSRLKIEAGYIDEDGAEVGVSTAFEGVIDRVSIGDDQLARVSALGYISVLTRHNISEISSQLENDMLVSDIVSAIMAVTDVSTFLSVGTNLPGNDIIIKDKSLLRGSFFEVLQKLAFVSLSVPIVDVSTFHFKSRDTNGTDVWTFYGNGNRSPDILKINKYDDEGADRVRLSWTDESTGLIETSQSTNLLARYSLTPQSVNLELLGQSSGTIRGVLTSLVSYWQFPRPVITFTTKCMLDQVKDGDQVRIDVRLNPIVLSSNGTYWGNFQWSQKNWRAAGASESERKGAILIKPSVKWIVTRIINDLDSWTSTITAEKIKVWRSY